MSTDKIRSMLRLKTHHKDELSEPMLQPVAQSIFLQPRPPSSSPQHPASPTEPTMSMPFAKGSTNLSSWRPHTTVTTIAMKNPDAQFANHLGDVRALKVMMQYPYHHAPITVSTQPATSVSPFRFPDSSTYYLTPSITSMKKGRLIRWKIEEGDAGRWRGRYAVWFDVGAKNAGKAQAGGAKAEDAITVAANTDSANADATGAMSAEPANLGPAEPVENAKAFYLLKLQDDLMLMGALPVHYENIPEDVNADGPDLEGRSNALVIETRKIRERLLCEGYSPGKSKV